MYLAIALFFSALSFAAEPNEIAHKLLDEAAATAGSTSLEIHILSLMHLGRTYPIYDKKKAIDFFRQAFAATSGAPEESRDVLQGEIVKWLADVSLPEAMEQLCGMSEPAAELEGKTSAIDRVIQLLLAKSEFDMAAVVIGLIPADADYPFRAAEQLFDQLPKDDPRRVLVFTRAKSAYQLHPERGFTEMLSTHWRKLPREVAESALNAVIGAVLAKKDDSLNFDGDTPGDDGKVILKSRRAIELAQMYQVLNGIDPKRAQQLVAANPELKSAMSQPLPEKKSEESKDQPPSGDEDAIVPPISMFQVADFTTLSERIGNWALAEKKVEEFVAAADKDLQQSLSRVADVQYPGMKAVAICGLAKKFAAKDQTTGRSLFDKCMTAVSDIKDPLELSVPLMSAAEAAHTINLKDQAWEAMQKAFTGASEAYVMESNAEKINKALREYWPSLQTCRVVAYRAAKLFGEEAEALLRGVRDTDMSVVMRIEMARALMKEPHSVHNVSFRF